MYRTDDDVIQVEVVEKIGNTVFPASDVSILNMPSDPLETRTLFKNLYNLPTDRHLCLVLFRHRKNIRLKSLANVGQIPSEWKFFDWVNMSYQMPAQSNGNCLVHLSELGVLIHKGKFTPSLERTKWFREDYANAGNHWDLSPQRGEIVRRSKFHDFSGEMVHLLLDLAFPMECGRMVYGFIDPSNIDNILNFAKFWKMPITLYASTNSKAEAIIKKYHEGDFK